MDNKEAISAANALIEWFNSQEIPPSNAESIMSKVQAKLFVARIPTGADSNAITAMLESSTLRLTTDINERLLHVNRQR